MNQINSKNNVNTVRILALIMAVLSLGLRLLYSVSYFFSYQTNHQTYKIELVFKFPDVINIVFMLLSLIPAVIVVLYFAALYKMPKSSFAVAAALVIISLTNGIGVLTMVLSGGRYVPINLLMNIVAFATYLVAAIGAAMGFKYKLVTVIPMGVALLLNAVSVLGYVSSFSAYLHAGLYLYMITVPVSVASSVLFCISIFAAVLLSVIDKPAAMPVTVSAPVYAMTKEEALAKLNERYDMDEITEEEYQRERMNIINNV